MSARGYRGSNVDPMPGIEILREQAAAKERESRPMSRHPFGRRDRYGNIDFGRRLLALRVHDAVSIMMDHDCGDDGDAATFDYVFARAMGHLDAETSTHNGFLVLARSDAGIAWARAFVQERW